MLVSLLEMVNLHNEDHGYSNFLSSSDVNQFIYKTRGYATMLWNRFTFNYKLILSLYILGFLIGGIHHWLDIVAGGLLPYRSVPLAFNIFLTSLALLDLLVVLLLLIKPLAGIALAIGIMILDLSVDIYLGFSYWNITPINNPGLKYAD